MSINGSPQALQLVKDGDLTQPCGNPLTRRDKPAFHAILDSIKVGKSWQPKTIEIPGVVVTKDNVDKFLADHPQLLSEPDRSRPGVCAPCGKRSALSSQATIAVT